MVSRTLSGGSSAMPRLRAAETMAAATHMARPAPGGEAQILVRLLEVRLHGDQPGAAHRHVGLVEHRWVASAAQRRSALHQNAERAAFARHR